MKFSLIMLPEGFLRTGPITLNTLENKQLAQQDIDAEWVLTFFIYNTPQFSPLF